MVISALAWKNLSLNAREMMSAMTLSFPATCIGTTVDALAACMRMPRMRSNLPAVMFLDVLILYAHATADILSQNMTRWVYYRHSIFCSRMRNTMTAPASSSVLMEMDPVGFSLVRSAD